jgi:hypothetical protein
MSHRIPKRFYDEGYAVFPDDAYKTMCLDGIATLYCHRTNYIGVRRDAPEWAQDEWCLELEYALRVKAKMESKTGLLDTHEKLYINFIDGRPQFVRDGYALYDKKFIVLPSGVKYPKRHGFDFIGVKPDAPQSAHDEFTAWTANYERWRAVSKRGKGYHK